MARSYPLYPKPPALTKAQADFFIAASETVPDRMIWTAAHMAVCFRLDVLDQKLAAIEKQARGGRHAPGGEWFPIMLEADEFLHHFAATFDSLLQEVNFLFGPRQPFHEQGASFNRLVHERNAARGFASIVFGLKETEWWRRARSLRNDFTHRCPDFIYVGAGLNMAYGRQDDPFYEHHQLYVVGSKEQDTNPPLTKPLVDDFTELRNCMHGYLERAYRAMEAELPKLRDELARLPPDSEASARNVEPLWQA